MADVKHFDAAAVLGVVVRLFWRQGLATTGIQDVVAATGISRSSLYATFGDKRQLYLAALDRYLDDYALPGFARLADDPRGLPAITEFFEQLIRVRCAGERARWGCLMVNAHAGVESSEPEVQRRLHRHYEHLRAAMRAALGAAHRLGQLFAEADIENSAEQLALLAYGVNLRSRAGVASAELDSTTRHILSTLATR